MNPAAGPLADLREIHAAPPPTVWPPAPGWWVLATVLAVCMVIAVIWLLRSYRRYRLQRLVLAEIERIGSRYTEENTTAFIAELSIVLRRIALLRYGPERVASLTGAEWLRFLDATGGGGEFSNGAGQILENGPYRPHQETVPLEPLLQLARSWAKQNPVAAA